ncbi:S1 RNA-binding domain-containing protein [Planktothrix sp. FACHB-1355]|uniref:S1 RNA-binding domain-containing protein n=1 Tax=Aerosakkonema funiforme FACHB-1375 TaxID=2949571 RepID=A0A926ZFW5_9CYAN|nr:MULTISPECIES: S1 RNA-binding domain-containing protein [Oscillatoriales]MBD2181568.1 S1 RNA-binding domain-containing protein [Aerosakkonema funiforme FACHB-1375]MBD3560655.1 S1 RNA-binding domain-containing protein [Planktothrix sp. FACHB-1355]
MKPKSTPSQANNSSFSMDDFAKALETHDYNFEKGQVVRGKAFEYASDGVYIDIGAKSSAFLPIQEIILKRSTTLSELLPLGEEREFLIIREQDADGQVTLSLKQLQIKQTWDKLAEMQDSGQTIQVKVTGVNKGGVTVDVKGVRGFIPRSHLIDKDKLEELIGQPLTASFLELDREREKLVLSQRLASQSARFSEMELGQLVEGKISGIKPFGLFVDLGGTTGLLHIKQISQTYIESLPNLFQVGQQIKAVIVDLDEGKSRISLSTRVLENHPGEMLENMAEVMASADARAQRAKKNISNAT